MRISGFSKAKCAYHCETKSTKSNEKMLSGNCGGSWNNE